MNRQPRIWVAVLLALLVQPLAMLYLERVRWALVYLLANLAIAGTEFYLLAREGFPWLHYFSFNYIVIVICVVHAYRVAKSFPAVDSRPWYSRWYGLLGIFAITLVALGAVRTFFYEPFSVPSGAMLPGYPPGSYLIAEKWGYGNYRLFGVQLVETGITRPVRRGDVVVFDSPHNPGIQYFKRIIGLPGDTLEYKDKRLTINGETAAYTPLTETGVIQILREGFDESTHRIQWDTRRPALSVSVTVPAGDYFVMGDNRDNSNDSRFWGFLPAENIIGKVIITIKPQ